MDSLRIVIGPFRQHASGVASYAVNLALAVASTGTQVTLLAMGKVPDDVNSISNIRVIDVAREDPRWLAFAGGPLVEAAVVRASLREGIEINLHEDRCDLVHFTGAPYAIPVGRSVAEVVTAWNDLSLIQSIRRNFVGFRFPLNVASLVATLQYHWQDHVGYSRADTIVCGTRGLVRKVQLTRGTHVRRVYHPIRAQGPGHRSDIESEIPTVLFVARRLGLPRKNLITLLRAIHLLIGRGLHDYKLCLMGEMDGDVLRVISELDLRSHISVELPGYLASSNRTEAFSRASIFVIPSVAEDYSYSLLEAMSYGIPVVASNIPSFRDITDDGSNGGLFNPWQPGSIADRLEVLLRDKGARVISGRRSLELVERRHDYVVSGPRLIELYRETIDSIEKPERVV